MRYDPDYPEWVFTTVKEMPKQAVREAIRENYRRQRLANGQTESRKYIKKIVAGILFTAALFIGILLSAMTANPAISVIFFGGALILLGLYTIVSGKSAGAPESRGLLFRAGGLMSILLGLCAVVPMLLINRIGAEKAFLIMGGSMFLTAGLYSVLLGIRFWIHAGANYGVPAEAQCIGFVHKIVRTKNSSHVESAEVFEYDYEGEHITAVNSVFRHSPAAEAGDYAELRINPRRPDEFHFSGGKSLAGQKIIGILFPLIFVGAGLFMLFGMTTGSFSLPAGRGIQESVYEPTAGPLELTDADIEKKLGGRDQKWEIGQYKLLRKYEEDGSRIAVFSGGLPVFCSDDVYDALKADAEYLLITDSECLKVYWILRNESYIYTGDHIVNDFRWQE